jgi:hypothetical protein
VPLSTELLFSFDNPRTSREIEYLRAILQRAYESEDAYCLPLEKHPEYISVEKMVDEFRTALHGRDPYVQEFFNQNESSDIIDVLARMWVVIRYDDEGEMQPILEAQDGFREAGELALVMLDEGHPVLENSKKLADYSYLLSLLAHSEGGDYYGRGFIIDRRYIHHRGRQYDDPWFHVLILGIMSRKFGEGTNRWEELDWTFFPYAKDRLLGIAKELDRLFASGRTEKLLYVGNILRIVGDEVNDVKVRVVLLTSLLELLVTHSPDFSRFNVEDSISKQFQYKVGTLTYLNDRTRDIYGLRKHLKTIYNIRSAIAHGDFQRVSKYVEGLSSEEGNEEYFDDLVTNLYVFLRAILEQYLKDPDFVDFLKAG